MDSFLRFSIDPSASNAVVPKSALGMTTAVKDISVQATFTPASADNSRAFVFSPLNGTISLVEYQKISQTSYSTQSVTSETSPVQFTFAAMYYPVMGSEEVQYFPTNTTTMKRDTVCSRLIAGSLYVRSASTSTTTSALSGTLSCGIVSDSRMNAYDTLRETAVRGLTFDSSTLQQCSISKKDSIYNIHIEHGVICIVGPNVSPTMGLFDFNSAHCFPGRWNGIRHQIAEIIDNSMLAFFSPYWALSATQGTTLTLKNIVVPRIGLTEAPMFRFNCNVETATGTGDCITVVHIYAAVASGLFTVDEIVDRRPIPTTVNDAGLAATYAEIAITFDPLPLPGRLWVGSLVRVYTGSGGTLKIASTDFIDSRSSQSGAMGPSTIITVDDVAVGQTVQMSGKLWMQYSPSMFLTPYVDIAKEGESSSILSDMRQLFDDQDSEYRCVWSKAEYDTFVRSIGHSTQTKRIRL